MKICIHETEYYPVYAPGYKDSIDREYEIDETVWEKYLAAKEVFDDLRDDIAELIDADIWQRVHGEGA
jgi:hypothetical protein